MNYQQKPPRWAEKLYRFMYGRNGSDTMCRDLTVLNIVLIIVNLFLRSPIVTVLFYVNFAYILFRMLSKNTVARRAENLKYWNYREKIRTSLARVTVLRQFGAWLKRKQARLAKLPTKAFRRCPGCHVELCLPRRRGGHEVHCPKCGMDFRVRIL